MSAHRRTVRRAAALLTVTLALVVGSLSPVAAATRVSAATPSATASPAELTPPGADASISGVVKDTGGTLLDSIVVEAFPAAQAGDPNADPVASALTYEDSTSPHGAYRLEVPAGEYKVRFSSLPDASTDYDTKWYGGGAGDTVTVTTGQAATLADTTLTVDVGATVTGTVLNPTTGYQGAEVDLLQWDAQDADWYYADSTMTDADGHYTFTGVNRGVEHTVRVYGDDGYTSVFYGDKVIGAQATRFTIATGTTTTTTLAPMHVAKGVDVFGKVLQTGGKPFRYVDVQLLAKNLANGTFEPVGWAGADENGRYHFNGVAPGTTYTVLVWAEWEGYTNTYLGGATTPAGASTFNPNGSVSPVTIATVTVAPSPVKATGVVVDAAGHGIEGVDVTAYQQYDGTFVDWDYAEHTTTDANGTYALRQVTAGKTYTVFADGTDVGFGTRYLGDAETKDTATHLVLNDNGTTAAQTAITLARAKRTVRGHVTLSDGTAFDGNVSVILQQWNATDNDWDYVDEYDGDAARYVFRDVAAGEHYRLDGSYSPRDDARQSHAGGTSDEFAVGGTEDDIVKPLTLTSGRRFGGTITTSDGGTAYGYPRVTLYKWFAFDDTDPTVGSFYVWDDTYARDGAYAFHALPTGDYAVKLDYSGFDSKDPYVGDWLAPGADPTSTSADGVFHVDDTATGNVTDLNLTLVKGTKVSGTVKTAGGTPLPEGHVSLSRWIPDGTGSRLESLDTVEVASDGTWSSWVAPGTSLFARAWRNGYRDAALGGGSGYPSDPAGHSRAVSTTTISDLDLTMTPEWGEIGSGPVQQDESCLAHTVHPYTQIPFGPTDGLFVTGTGLISDQAGLGTFRPELLDATGRVSVLAPFMDRSASYFLDEYNSGSSTWGISGNTLCVLWNDVPAVNGAGSNTYQALITKSAGAGYDVVFNYDSIQRSRQAKAGWNEGSASGTRSVFAGASAGYLDSAATTGLANTSQGSATVGRHAFHFNGFGGPNAAPENTRRPTVAGVFAAGETLTANPGTWDTAGLSYVYTWKSERAGNAYVVGTGPTYVPTANDRNHPLWVVVQGTNGTTPRSGFGSSSRRYVAAGPRAATNDALPAITTLPAHVGDTLHASTGTWTATDPGAGPLTFDYDWFVGGHRVYSSSETGDDYVVQDEDELKAVTVKVTASQDGDHAPVTVTSAPATVQASPTLQTTVAPTITGNPAVGSALTAHPGTWTSGAALFEYTWRVGGSYVEADNASGAGDVYTPKSADAGKVVSVKVLATAPGFKSGTASASTQVISAAGVGFGAITGTARRASDSSVVPGASYEVCEHGTYTCRWGTTNGSGQFSVTSLPATDTGLVYDVVVTGTSGLKDGTATVTLVKNQTATPTVLLDAVLTKPSNVTIPTSNGTEGNGVPTVYWSAAQTFNITGCATGSPSYTVTFSDGTPTRSGPMTDTTPGVIGVHSYTFTIPPFYPTHGDIRITTNVPANCDPSTPPTKFDVYIDPSGVVTDQYGRPVSGATVTLLRSDTQNGSFSAVPDGSTIMSSDNRVNPVTTGSDGFFRWDVSEGYYKVKVQAPGCNQVVTSAMPVPPPAVDLLIRTTCTAAGPAPTAAPTITGDPTVGRTLTTQGDLWAGSDPESIQWLRNGSPIGGATGTSYTLVGDDANKSISVRHRAQRPDYVQEEGRGATVTFTPAEATSAGVAVSNPPVVTPPPPPPPPVVVKKASLSTTSLPKRTVSHTVAAKAVGKVTVVGVAAPTGKLTFYRGTRAVKSVVLTAASRGKATISLGKLRKGKYAIKVKYAGSPTIKGSTSKVVYLTVK